jgi:urease accessory protein
MKRFFSLSLALLAFAPTLVFAHAGHEHALNGFIDGLLHPLTGLDHLAMLLGLGALGAWQSRPQRIQLYVGSLGILFAGALLGLISGFETGIEMMILASIFFIALAIFFSLRGLLPLLAAIVLVMFHGWAHGLEMPVGAIFSFMPGMLIMAAVLMGVGYLLGRKVEPKQLGVVSAAAAGLIAWFG